MIERHGSREAVAEIMRSNAAKSARNKVGTGGFASMTKEKRLEVSKKGVEARAKKNSTEG